MSSQTKPEKPKVQLTGEDGNAYFIIARCRKAARRAGWTDEQIAEFTKEAQSGNYKHLVDTAMKYFEVE